MRYNRRNSPPFRIIAPGFAPTNSPGSCSSHVVSTADSRGLPFADPGDAGAFGRLGRMHHLAADVSSALTPAILALVMAAGGIAGCMGALLGLGGGVFL